MTRGHKSSERKSCYHAFYAGFVLAGFGLYMQVQDLSGLGVLIGVVVSPLSVFFPAARVINKIKNGEQDVVSSDK